MTDDFRMGLMLFTVAASVLSIVFSLSTIRLTKRTKEQVEKNRIANDLLKNGNIVIKTDEDLERFQAMVLKEWHEWHDSKLIDN